MKLPKHAVKRVEKWLELPDRDKKNKCPFKYKNPKRYLSSHRCKYCYWAFPDKIMIIEYSSGVCPCNIFPLSKVIAKAKEIVSDLPPYMTS